MAMENIFSYFREMVIDFFYPPHCPVCERYIENRSDILCEECERKILDIRRSPEEMPPLKEIWRLTKYKEGTQQLILDLKFNNKLNGLPAINRIFDKALIKNDELPKLLNKIDIATAVPLHIEREKERGFNQVELIFNDWLNKQNIQMERLLLRTRATDHLYDKNREQRQKEVAGAFSLIEGAADKVQGKRILILDDIFTTGTTMSECAKVLQQNDSAEIYGLALASDFRS